MYLRILNYLAVNYPFVIICGKWLIPGRCTTANQQTWAVPPVTN